MTVTNIDDPPQLASDPSAPQWAPVSNKLSIFARLSTFGTGGSRPRAEDDSSAFLSQTMVERLGSPHKKARVAIPEETTSAPAPVLSEGLERRLSQDHSEDTELQLQRELWERDEDRRLSQVYSEATVWQLERELWELDEELRLEYGEGGDSPGWEVPDIDFTVMTTAEPQAAQSGGINPAHRN